MGVFSKLIGRESEIYQLQGEFLSEVIEGQARRTCLSYLVTGRQGVGKTRMIEAFLESLENDQRIAVHIPTFTRQKHLFEYRCEKEMRKPYQTFIEIQKEIDRQYRQRRVFRNIAMLLISWLPINLYDVIDALEKMKTEFKEGEASKKQKALEIRTYSRYLRMLHRLSRNVPICFYIRNVQWIDIHSMKLIQSLMEGVGKNSFWGMITLEENDEAAQDHQIVSILKRLVGSGKLRRMVVKPMNKGFENRIMSDLFGSNLFTANELDHMYTLSEGYPGLLAKHVEDWLDKKWIYQDNEIWQKVNGFEDKIKPPIKKILDLIIVFLQDGEISLREKELINNYANDWDISEEVVTQMINLILKCRELGYYIERRVHKGTVTEHAFLARGENDEKLIVEYIRDESEIKKKLVPRELHHPRILSAREIKLTADGILLVNDYYEGKTLREDREQADEMHIRNVIQTSEQIAEGLAELHRNGIIHGFLRPETIIKSPTGEVRLTGIDASNLNIKRILEEENPVSFYSYCSPEELDHKRIDQRSDVYSFGIVLFELLTGELPFKGANLQELKQSIKYSELPDFRDIKLRIPLAIQQLLSKCMDKNPSTRYASAEEVIDDLKEVVTASFNPVQEQIKIDSSETPSVRGTSLLPRRLVEIAASLLILASLALAGRYIIREVGTRRVVEETIMVSGVDISNRANVPTRLNGEIIQYLIMDDIMQSTHKNIYTLHEFIKRWGTKKQPELTLSAFLTIRDVNYELDLSMKRPGERTEHLVKDFGDPGALLKSGEGIISGITRDILHRMDENPILEESVFTESWDAFEYFYRGEKAWLKLDITYSEECLKSALTYDNDFILAKLRLAQVLNFNGYYAEARDLILKILPRTGLLSKLDSLKCRALQSRLEGEYFEEIEILREIQNQYPTRREAAYDLAEAYYQICDVNNAIVFYKRALYLDPEYARAINHLAYCYTHLGDHDNALLYFRQYLSHDSTANAFDSYGDGLMATGDYDRAEWAKKAGIDLDPKLYYLWGSLGFINLFQGKFKEAEHNFNRYIDLSSNDIIRSGGYFRLAMIPFLKGDYESALQLCLTAKHIHDSYDLTDRDHELHWLLGLIYLELGNEGAAKEELRIMDSIVVAYNLNDTKYEMLLYKSYLHLKAAIALSENDMEEFDRIISTFDNALNPKVKDHTSAFDLAYLNNSFGEMLLKKGTERRGYALERFEKALEYNPNYALSHYYLFQIYSETGDEEKTANHLYQFKSLWDKADQDLKELYGI